MHQTIVKILLAATALIELTVAGIMLIKPSMFNEVCGESTLSLSRSFAAGAFSVGCIALISLWKMEQWDIKLILLLLAIYNLGIAIVQIFYPVDGVPAFMPVVFHLVLSVMFVYYFLNKAKLHEKP